MRKISGMLVFIICLPLIGTMFIRRDGTAADEVVFETSTADERFTVLVHENAGDMVYGPEMFTALMMHCIIPENMEFTSSEDYIVTSGTGGAAHDPEQEYLKALAVICRTDIVYVWEQAERPDMLDFDKMGLECGEFARSYADTAADSGEKTRRDEIKKAVNATMGAVITKENEVAAAPFFTTSDADMLVGEPGDGTGFSLNFAYELAVRGMDFYEILKNFFGDIKIIIYE